MTDAELRKMFPEIKWDTPVRVQVVDEPPRFLCRYCIAKEGLKAREVQSRGGGYEDIVAHIESEHKGGA